MDALESSLARAKKRGAAKQTASAEQAARAPEEDNEHHRAGTVH
jgi:hypothetical protein